MIYEVKAAKKADIDHIIYDDEIYDRIFDDNIPSKEQFEIPSGLYAIGGYINSEIASLYVVHDSKMHFMALKEYRIYSRKLLDLSLLMHGKPVYVEIPKLYQSVINFAKKAGFKEVAIIPESHLKNGNLYDIHRLVYEV